MGYVPKCTDLQRLLVPPGHGVAEGAPPHPILVICLFAIGLLVEVGLPVVEKVTLPVGVEMAGLKLEMDEILATSANNVLVCQVHFSFA